VTGERPEVSSSRGRGHCWGAVASIPQPVPCHTTYHKRGTGEVRPVARINGGNHILVSKRCSVCPVFRSAGARLPLFRLSQETGSQYALVWDFGTQLGVLMDSDGGRTKMGSYDQDYRIPMAVSWTSPFWMEVAGGDGEKKDE